MVQNKNYKRQTREMPISVRQKISAKLKGKPKTFQHRVAISNSLKAETGGYWSKIPVANKKDGDTTIQDIML